MTASLMLAALTASSSVCFADAQGVRLTGSLLERRNLLFSFAASERGIAFPVLLNQNRSGLAYFDRASKSTALIEEPDANLNQPNFTEDGANLLFVRIRRGSDIRELISCATATWTCQVVLRTQDAVSSPIYVDSHAILYAASPVRSGHLPVNYDFYLLRIGSEPVRLSDVKFSGLSALSATKDKIIFEAGGRANDRLIPQGRPYPISKSDSHIFSLPFDRATPRVEIPSVPLPPLFPIEGFSIRPRTSDDGKYVAFLNARGGGTYVFNLVLAEARGRILREIRTTGIGFSRPAFVGDEVVANELVSDRYRVRRFDTTTDQSELLLDLDSSEKALQALDQINLNIQGANPT